MAPKADPYENLQYGMDQIHTAIRTAHGQILKVARERDEAELRRDLTAWLGYVGAWVELLGHHHDIEEKAIFPRLKDKGCFVENEIEQHQAIHRHIDAMEAALAEWRADPSTYSSARLVSLFEAIDKDLFEHLDDEVQKLLNPSNLRAHINAQDITYIYTTARKEADSIGNPAVDLPFLAVHTPPGEHKNFLGLPLFVRYTLLPFWYWQRSHFWKYAPYSLL